MKALKWIGIILLLLLLAGAALIFTAPASYKMERHIIIKADKAAIYPLIAILHERKKWYPWPAQDPEGEYLYGGSPGEVGSSFSWKSKITGEGEELLTTLVPEKLAESNISIKSPMARESKGWIELKEVGSNETEVIWGLAGENSLLDKLTSTFFSVETVMGPDYEAGLEQLKELAEKEFNSGQSNRMPVFTVKFSGRTYLTLREKHSMNTLYKDFYARAYKELIDYCQQKNIQINGFPSALVYDRNEAAQTLDIAAALPIDRAPAAVDGKFKVVTLPSTSAASLEFEGPYSKIWKAHTAISQWLTNQRHQRNTALPILEVNKNDQQRQKDSTKWLTQVMYFY